jgi:hypothetical protein
MPNQPLVSNLSELEVLGEVSCFFVCNVNIAKPINQLRTAVLTDKLSFELRVVFQVGFICLLLASQNAILPNDPSCSEI